MGKINVAELLQDCPKGMELDCIICDGVVTLEGISGNGSSYPIRVISKDGFHHSFSKFGEVYNHKTAKCVIFPKGKTTWEGFHRPFKEGDIAATNDGTFIGIVKCIDEENVCTYCAINTVNSLSQNFSYYFHRFATEEEKQKLFDAIRENGYKWNAETRTLERLVEPKFKVGDKVREKGDEAAAFTISDIDDLCYYYGEYVICNICDQDEYELVPNKFDITTLEAFNKVLYRIRNNDTWCAGFYNFYKNNHHFVIGNAITHQCIPYNNDTKHLLGTTNDCDEYYKTWE